MKMLSLYTLARIPAADTLRLYPANHIPALSATAISAFRGPLLDLLIVKLDNTLAILTHGLRIVNVRFAPREFPSSSLSTDTPDAATHAPNVLSANVQADDAMSEDEFAPAGGDDAHSDVSMRSIIDKEKIVAVSEPLHSSVTVHFEGGGTTRTKLVAATHDHLTGQCFSVLSYALTGPRAFALHCLWIEKWKACGASDANDEEWKCFVDALCEMVEIRSPYHVEDAPQATPGSWEDLAYSASHERLEHDVVFKCLDAPFRPRRPVIQPPKKAPHPDIVPSLLALHTLGESYKLKNDAVYACLPRLATLLVALGQAARPEWADHWVRLFPDIYEGWADPKRQGISFLRIRFVPLLSMNRGLCRCSTKTSAT